MFDRRASALLVSAVCLASPALAASWPEIPRADWDLQAAPGAPKAPGVVLLDRGRLVFDDQGRSSFLEVYTRMKVLNEEGRALATLSVSSSRARRLRELEGRTHLPDGRVVELPADAKFEKTYDAYFRYSVHSVALPAVEVGSIVETRYKLYFDSVLFTEPWYFQARLPTIRSEFSVEYPQSFGFSPVQFSPYGLKIQGTTERTPRSHRAAFAMDNLPAVPDEPFRLAFHDLAAWVLVLPLELVSGGRTTDLLRSWPHTLQLLRDYGFDDARRADGAARARAKALAGNLKEPRAKVEALYRFVQGEIAHTPWPDVTAGKEWPVDKTLSEKKGSSIDKVLLLQAMLKAVKVESQLGWVRSRSSGRVQENVPTPYQFDHALLVLELDGQELFLDPTDPDLPLGELSYEHEGVRCLLADGEDAVWATTPIRPPSGNLRSARLTLDLSPEGRLAGKGSLALTGHWSWRARQAAASAGDPKKYWREWLEGRLPGFDLDAIEVSEETEKLATHVSWTLAQRADVVAGDEVSFDPSTPLGISASPFSAAMRQSPVDFDFADVDEVELALSWPEGWQLEGRPKLQQLANLAGSLETSLTAGAERSLVVKRRFTVAQRLASGTKPFAELKSLYAKVAANDAEELVLVKP